MLAHARKRLAALAGAVLAVGAFAPGLALAQTADDVRAMEAKLKALARAASPKTVCIKSYIEDDGDKAGYGSGAIVTEDGFIITCAHVVDIAKRCEVMLADGTTYKAKLLGKNKRQDYALVKIDAHGLTPFELGDSSKVSVGDWVVALGHPGGPYEDLRPSFAAGRITGLHRKLPVSMMDRFYDDGIQTDVPIVFGNSGGPLVGLDGKLVGLNGAIIMINDNAFAVPINEISADLEAMKKGEMIAGREATEKDMAEFQKSMDPEMMQKLLSRGMKNLGKLFGGKDGENPLGKMFGGKGGENPFGDLFGKDGGGDLGKMFGKLFKQRGEKGDKDEDGDQDEGQGMDLGALMKQFQKMFGGKDGGDGQDLGKMLEGLRKMFQQGGGEDEGDDDEPSAPAPAPRARRAPGGERLEPAVDRGGYLGLKGDAAEGKGGVLVSDVVEGGPAAKAGLKAGDVVVSVGKTLTPDIAALQGAVKRLAPGTEATLTLDRTRLLDATVVRERVEVKVTIGARDKAGK